MASSERREGVGRTDGARTPEVAALMQQAVEEGVCPFCSPRFEETNGDSRVDVVTDTWNVWHNLSPFEGASNHIMLAPVRHVHDLTELNGSEWIELFALINAIRDLFEFDSYSLLSRSGDGRYNSATVDHLHLHLIESDAEPVGDEYFTAEERRLVQEVLQLLSGYPDGDYLEELDRLRVLVDAYRSSLQGKAFPIRAKLANEIR